MTVDIKFTSDVSHKQIKSQHTKKSKQIITHTQGVSLRLQGVRPLLQIHEVY